MKTLRHLAPPLMIFLSSSALACAANVSAEDYRALLVNCCADSTSAALTAAVPSKKLLKTTSLGAIQVSNGVYDVKDNLLLFSDFGTVDAFNYPSLTLKSTIPAVTALLIRVYGDTAYGLGFGYTGPATIYKFSASTGSTLATVEVPVGGDYEASPTGAELSADGKLLYALYNYQSLQGDSFSSTMYVFNTDSMTVVSNWDLSYPFSGSLVLTGLGHNGYYTAYSADSQAEVVACDLYTGVATATKQFESPEGGVTNPVLSPDHSIVYAGTGRDLLVLDAETLQVQEHVLTVANLLALTSTLDGSYLYLTEKEYGYTILATPSLENLGTIPNENVFPLPPLFVPR